MNAQRNPQKRPSMFEVAEMAGVSHQTVSRVINHSSEVSDETRTRVQRAIDMLGYRPSNSARTLASKRSRTVGLIAGGLSAPGTVSTIAAVESVVRSRGMFLAVSMMHEARCTQREFEDICRTFEEQNVDAFIFLTPTDIMFSDACRTRLSKTRVLVTSTHGNLSMSRAGGLMDAEGRRHTAIVGIDHWGAMRDVARLIARFGHRSALYFAGPLQWRNAATRLLGWRKGSAIYRIQSKEIQCSSWDSSEAYARMNHELETLGSLGAQKPTVIVTANDAQAIGVARALHEHGLRIPQDVSLVGFDDMTGVNDMWPPLTTVRPDFQGLGTAAMREALRLLGEGGETTFVANAHGAGLIPAEVIQRHSLGPVPRL